jgi:hypothetical protein
MLVPPRRVGDCGCTFCGLFRAHHYWLRAAGATITVPLLLTFALAVHRSMVHSHALPGEVVPIFGALLIAVTGLGLLALCMWYQPLRRLLHMIRPRPGDATV